MALMTGLRHAEALAGIVGLSGYLPLAGLTAAERSAANQATPIFMAHGEQDRWWSCRVPPHRAKALQALGYNVQWQQYPMPHSVCMEEVADLNRWLLQVLADKAA